ncbi:MAG: response regulator transcription factor [Acidobacteria bacterium]|nr:response regulator transcription factor [Acidobacteriota bacterium]
MKYKVLLIEDEPGLCLTLKDRLQKEGYDIEVSTDGESGFNLAANQAYDLILLDLMLPKKNGNDVCRDLRQMGLAIPILMLTAKTQTVDKVLGLKIGADDYLTKPFEMQELLARIEALLRRAMRTFTAAPLVYQFGNIRVDFRKTEILRNGEAVTFSAKEFQLLRYFIDHREETLSRETLLQEVWGYSSVPYTRTIDVHVAWLRQKLEEDPKQPRWILTIHGLGYKFAG